MITRPNGPQSPSIITDLSVVSFLAAAIYLLVHLAKHWEAPLQPQDYLLAGGVLTTAIIAVMTNRYLWQPLYRLAKTKHAQ